MIRALWEDFKLFMLLMIIALSVVTLPYSVSAIYNQVQELRAETSLLDARIMKNRYRLCAVYREVWRWHESRPLLAPYNKPSPLLEEDCRLTWEQ